MSITARVRRAVFGAPKDVKDPHAFHKLSLVALLAWVGLGADGLSSSAYGPDETMSRFEAEVRARGMTVFARIDHAAGATAVGLQLRPTDLLIFGAAKAGTPLMQQVQTVGIDLPLKALVWQDASGTTWLSYNDPAWVAQRHGLDEAANATVNAMSQALHAIAINATAAA